MVYHFGIFLFTVELLTKTDTDDPTLSQGLESVRSNMGLPSRDVSQPILACSEIHLFVGVWVKYADTGDITHSHQLGSVRTDMGLPSSNVSQPDPSL